MKPFPQTRWSLILNAQEKDPRALGELCQAYWFPLYGYARRIGLRPEDAEDLTQAFFEKLLEREFFQKVRQEGGRLRSLLLTSMKNFALDLNRREAALKRGGGNGVLPIDALSAEERFNAEPKDRVTPEVEFDRCWAREILRLALAKLRAAYDETGKGPIFHALQCQLMAGQARPYQEIAKELDLTESTARVAAFKLRQRYRRFIEEAVNETVASAEQAAEELAYLQSLFEEPIT